MNIKIYVKTINIFKKNKKILKIVCFISVYKKIYSSVEKIFYKYFIIFKFISLEILYYEFNNLYILKIFLSY